MIQTHDLCIMRWWDSNPVENHLNFSALLSMTDNFSIPSTRITSTDLLAITGLQFKYTFLSLTNPFTPVKATET